MVPGPFGGGAEGGRSRVRDLLLTASALLFLGALLWTVRGVLNPIVLLILLAALAWPQRPDREHLRIVGVATVVTALWLLQTLGSLLAPFALGLAFAYILHPGVDRLERRGMPRPAAIGLLALPVLLGVGALFFWGIPALGLQIERLIQSAPDLVQNASRWLELQQRRLLRADLPGIDERALIAQMQNLDPAVVVETLRARQQEIGRRLWGALLGVGRGVGVLVNILGYLVLTPILTFYLLNDYHRIIARLGALVPPRLRPQTEAFAREYDRLLARYLRGQLIAAVAVGIFIGVGLAVVGFPYAILIGVLAGVLNVVPYMGMLGTIVPGIVISLFSGNVLLSLGKLAGVLVAEQIFEQVVVTPRFIGQSVSLHPVWVVLALAVFGYFFGFIGLLLAVPLAVLLKMLLALMIERYRTSAVFRAGEPPPTPPLAEPAG